jgi:hypothetical protein
MAGERLLSLLRPASPLSGSRPARLHICPAARDMPDVRAVVLAVVVTCQARRRSA